MYIIGNHHLYVHIVCIYIYVHIYMYIESYIYIYMYNMCDVTYLSYAIYDILIITCIHVHLHHYPKKT